MYTRYYRGSVAKTTFYKKVYISSRFVTKIAPEARFVVSYATASGELIADSMALNVVDYMINKVKDSSIVLLRFYYNYILYIYIEYYPNEFPYVYFFLLYLLFFNLYPDQTIIQQKRN